MLTDTTLTDTMLTDTALTDAMLIDTMLTDTVLTDTMLTDTYCLKEWINEQCLEITYCDRYQVQRSPVSGNFWKLWAQEKCTSTYSSLAHNVRACGTSWWGERPEIQRDPNNLFSILYHAADETLAEELPESAKDTGYLSVPTRLNTAPASPLGLFPIYFPSSSSLVQFELVIHSSIWPGGWRSHSTYIRSSDVNFSNSPINNAWLSNQLVAQC